MATSLAWYTLAGAAVTGDTAITGLSGTPGTEVELQLINNKDSTGADPLTNARLKALFDSGSGLQESGTEWADRGYLQARVKSTGWNTNQIPTDWITLGSFSTLELPEVGNDEGVTIGFRLNAPPSAAGDAETVSLRVVDSPSEATSQGITEAQESGIYCGIGDASFSWIISSGDVIETGTPDANANVQDTVYVSKGKPRVVLAQAVNIPVAASGSPDQERYDVLSLKLDGTGITRTAGTEVDTGTATEDDKPDPPTDEIPLCFIFREATGNVENNDIENVWEDSQGFYLFTGTTLTGSVSSGPSAVVDNSVLHNVSDQPVALTDDATNYLWLDKNGIVGATTDGSQVENRAIPIWEVVTASGSVTSITDRRHFIGADFDVIEFEFIGEVTAADERYRHAHTVRDGWIFPINGFGVTLGTQVAGGSAGDTEIDIEIDDGGTGAFASIFGTGTIKPQIAWNATDLRDLTGALPDDFTLPPKARVRAQIHATPTATTQALDVTVTLLVVY